MTKQQLKDYFNQWCRGSSRAVSKQRLCRVFNTSERQARMLIEELRNEKFYIVSTSKSKGYWLYDEKNHTQHEAQQLRIMLGELHSRRAKLIKTIIAMESAILNVGQLNFKEME